MERSVKSIVESDKNTLVELYNITKKIHYIDINIDKYNAI